MAVDGVVTPSTESLLKVNISGREINIAKAVIEIVEQYVQTKINSFEQFIKDCERLKSVSKENFDEIVKKGRFTQVLEEIIRWSKIEFNYVSEDDNSPGEVVDDDEDDTEEAGVNT